MHVVAVIAEGVQLRSISGVYGGGSIRGKVETVIAGGCSIEVNIGRI